MILLINFEIFNKIFLLFFSEKLEAWRICTMLRLTRIGILTPE